MAYFSVDVGGTSMRVAIYEDLGKPVEIARRTLHTTRSFTTDSHAIIGAIRALASEHDERIQGVGFGIAGHFDSLRTTLTGSGNLNGWIGKPIRQKFVSQLGCPVAFANDAEVGGMAEAYYGHGKGDNGETENFIFFTWGTGLGGCLMYQAGGRIIPLPGEPGHQNVNHTGDLVCECGQANCFEAYVGGQGIENHYGIPPRELPKEGWDEVLEWLVIGVRNLVTVFPVPLVVFGGGMANKESYLLPRLEQRLTEELTIVRAPVVKLSAFNEDANSVGALALLNVMV